MAMIATDYNVNLTRSLWEFWANSALTSWPVLYPEMQSEMSDASAWMELQVPLLREEVHRESGLLRVRMTLDVHCFAGRNAGYGEALRMSAAVRNQLSEQVVIRDFGLSALPALGVLRFREPIMRQFADRVERPEMRPLSHVLVSAEGVADLPGGIVINA